MQLKTVKTIAVFVLLTACSNESSQSASFPKDESKPFDWSGAAAKTGAVASMIPAIISCPYLVPGIVIAGVAYIVKEGVVEQDRIAAWKEVEQRRIVSEKEAERYRIDTEKEAERYRIDTEKKAERYRIDTEKEAQRYRIDTEKKAERYRIDTEKEAERNRIVSEKEVEHHRIVSEKEAERYRIETEKEINKNKEKYQGAECVIYEREEKPDGTVILKEFISYDKNECHGAHHNNDNSFWFEIVLFE